jgi:Uma2 family endonuclease
MVLDVETLPPPHLLTWKDWLEIPESAECRYELLEGELHMSPTPLTRHQRISRNLGFLIETWVRRTGAGELFLAPTGVRLSDRDVVVPDLLVLSAARSALAERRFIAGAPDLMVEILSPGTVRRDLRDKRALYEKAGVREYWIVDPIAERVEQRVSSAGVLRLVGSCGRDEVLRAVTLPGLEIALAEVFPPS